MSKRLEEFLMTLDEETRIALVELLNRRALLEYCIDAVEAA